MRINIITEVNVLLKCLKCCYLQLKITKTCVSACGDEKGMKTHI